MSDFVIEYHYTDGDISADELCDHMRGEPLQHRLDFFDITEQESQGRDKLDKIIIRRYNPDIDK